MGSSNDVCLVPLMMMMGKTFVFIRFNQSVLILTSYSLSSTPRPTIEVVSPRRQVDMLRPMPNDDDFEFDFGGNYNYDSSSSSSSDSDAVPVPAPAVSFATLFSATSGTRSSVSARIRAPANPSSNSSPVDDYHFTRIPALVNVLSTLGGDRDDNAPILAGDIDGDDDTSSAAS